MLPGSARLSPELGMGVGWVELCHEAQPPRSCLGVRCLRRNLWAGLGHFLTRGVSGCWLLAAGTEKLGAALGDVESLRGGDLEGALAPGTTSGTTTVINSLTYNNSVVICLRDITLLIFYKTYRYTGTSDRTLEYLVTAQLPYTTVRIFPRIII